MKTEIIVRRDGKVTLETRGRGESALRWVERLTITKGTVQVDWRILPSARTKSPEIVVSDLVSMNDCIVRAVGGLEFPPPPTDRPVYVSHKFVFKAEPKP